MARSLMPMIILLLVIPLLGIKLTRHDGSLLLCFAGCDLIASTWPLCIRQGAAHRGTLQCIRQVTRTISSLAGAHARMWLLVALVGSHNAAGSEQTTSGGGVVAFDLFGNDVTHNPHYYPDPDLFQSVLAVDDVTVNNLGGIREGSESHKIRWRNAATTKHSRAVDLEVYNASEYRQADADVNKVVGGGSMFQINLRNLVSRKCRA